jgi:hypothetical protein
LTVLLIRAMGRPFRFTANLHTPMSFCKQEFERDKLKTPRLLCHASFCILAFDIMLNAKPHRLLCLH